MPVNVQRLRVAVGVIVVVIAAWARCFAAPASTTHGRWPSPDWAISTPEAQGISSKKLADAIERIRARRWPIHDIVVIRHGYLVLDASFFPYRKDEPHDIASVTKSVTSTLVGIALDKGFFTSVDEPLVHVFPKAADPSDSRKQRVTLASLLEMRSGLDCRNVPGMGEVTLFQMFGEPDWVRFVYRLPMATTPGARFVYCSPGMHLLSGMISKTVGENELAFGEANLFGPLEIPKPVWPTDLQARNHGFGDLHLRPREMAKLGYLYLRHGVWDRKQVVSRSWIETATQPHPTGGIYGYGWWMGGDIAPFPFGVGGRGGQEIAVDPSRDLVVVTVGGGVDTRDVNPLLRAAIVSNKPLPPDAEGRARLAVALAAAANPPPARARAPLPAAAARLSGRVLKLSPNLLGFKTIALKFDGTSQAQAQITDVNPTDQTHRLSSTGWQQVGLDGVPRVGRANGSGSSVALDGTWLDDRTFQLHYDMIGDILNVKFTITLSGNDADVVIEEQTLNFRSEGHASIE